SAPTRSGRPACSASPSRRCRSWARPARTRWTAPGWPWGTPTAAAPSSSPCGWYRANLGRRPGSIYVELTRGTECRQRPPGGAAYDLGRVSRVTPRPEFSAQTLSVLAALCDQPSQWQHGYALAKQTGLKSGTLYPILIRLADRGLVEACWQDEPQPGRPRRHLYRLTATRPASATGAPASAAQPAAAPTAPPP